MKKLLLPFYLIHALQGAAQSVRSTPGSMYTGLGAYSHHFTQAFSFPANQAALAHLSQISAGVFAEKKFGLKELALYQATAAMPVKGGGIGIVLHYSGFTDFNESQIGLAYGKNLGPVSLGVQCNYNMVHVAGYGNDAAVGVEMGTIWHITARLYTGIHVANPAGAEFRNHYREKLASVYELGAGYEVSDQLFIGLVFSKEENRPLNIQTALQYAVANRLFVRLGMSTATASPFVGLGWRWKNGRADITANYHPQLGLSPGLLLIFYGKTTASP